MNRREFLRVVGIGSMTLFLSGCGLNAVAGDNQTKAKTSEQSSISGGKNMKIVVDF